MNLGKRANALSCVVVTAGACGSRAVPANGTGQQRRADVYLQTKRERVTRCRLGGLPGAVCLRARCPVPACVCVCMSALGRRSGRGGLGTVAVAMFALGPQLPAAEGSTMWTASQPASSCEIVANQGNARPPPWPMTGSLCAFVNGLHLAGAPSRWLRQ